MSCCILALLFFRLDLDPIEWEIESISDAEKNVAGNAEKNSAKNGSADNDVLQIYTELSPPYAVENENGLRVLRIVYSCLKKGDVRVRISIVSKSYDENSSICVVL